MGGKPLGAHVSAVKSNPDVFKAVAENRNAIGIIGVSWISSDLSGRQKSVEELAQAVEKSDTTTLQFSQDVKVLKIRGNNEVTAYKPYQHTSLTAHIRSTVPYIWSAQPPAAR